jgi:hypothetical protein
MGKRRSTPITPDDLTSAVVRVLAYSQAVQVPVQRDLGRGKGKVGLPPKGQLPNRSTDAVQGVNFR